MCKTLPNRIIEAFRPEAFQAVGYPVTVRDEIELFKYVDVMREPTFEVVYSVFWQGITGEEFQLVQSICSLPRQVEGPMGDISAGLGFCQFWTGCKFPLAVCGRSSL